ncbi:hypothetical protein [uncultured Algimonas sp.]|uniref:hypothetical protein n=1 Tax=uncultured Algimonas sp. TaxID=1547920 RepID=UPI002616507E|nr:hypothetical protein [uncultured Algimonas sp.]
MDLTLSGTVSPSCGIQPTRNNETVVDFGDLALVPVNQEITVNPRGAIRYVCNDPDGFTTTITSLNGGRLVRTGTSGGVGNQIDYTINSTGGSRLRVRDGSLASPIVRSVPARRRSTRGRRADISFKIKGVLSQGTGPQGSDTVTAFAGDYSDVVTISLVAN